jgi:Fe-S cluster biosynthesis and repair protein YggX
MEIRVSKNKWFAWLRKNDTKINEHQVVGDTWNPRFLGGRD